MDMRRGTAKELVRSTNLYKKRHAEEILQVLHSKGIEAIVAGGMPRDYILSGKDINHSIIKDIDVYIKPRKPVKDLKRLNFHGQEFRRAETHYEGINNIIAVFEGKYVSDDMSFSRVQFILVDYDKPLTNYVEDFFDLSICQCAFDGVNFWESEAFKKTLEDKVITINDKLPINSLEYALNQGHIAKIQKRFKYIYPIKELTNRIQMNYYPNGDRYKVIKRTKLADKMVKDYLYKNENWLIQKGADYVE